MIDHDWEYSETECPKCQSQMAFRGCNGCGGEGWLDDDEDDEWGSSGSCDNCAGKGFEEWCRDCGWDNTYRRFMGPQYERAFQEKQIAIANQQSANMKHET